MLVFFFLDAYSTQSNPGLKSNYAALKKNALTHNEDWPFSAWSMICRSAFFRLLALSISCSLDLKGLDWSLSLLSGEMDPAGTSWALASSLRALTNESSFSFSMAHWEIHIQAQFKTFSTFLWVYIENTTHFIWLLTPFPNYKWPRKIPVTSNTH